MYRYAWDFIASTNDGCADGNEITSGMVVKRLVVHVTLRSAGCMICRSTKGSAINLISFASTLRNRRAMLRLKPLFSADLAAFPQSTSRTNLWKAVRNELCGEAVKKKKNLGTRERKKGIWKERKTGVSWKAK